MVMQRETECSMLLRTVTEYVDEGDYKTAAKAAYLLQKCLEELEAERTGFEPADQREGE